MHWKGGGQGLFASRTPWAWDLELLTPKSFRRPPRAAQLTVALNSNLGEGQTVDGVTGPDARRLGAVDLDDYAEIGR